MCTSACLCRPDISVSTPVLVLASVPSVVSTALVVASACHFDYSISEPTSLLTGAGLPSMVLSAPRNASFDPNTLNPISLSGSSCPSSKRPTTPLFYNWLPSDPGISALLSTFVSPVRFSEAPTAPLLASLSPFDPGISKPDLLIVSPCSSSKPPSTLLGSTSCTFGPYISMLAPLLALLHLSSKTPSALFCSILRPFDSRVSASTSLLGPVKLSSVTLPALLGLGSRSFDLDISALGIFFILPYYFSKAKSTPRSSVFFFLTLEFFVLFRRVWLQRYRQLCWALSYVFLWFTSWRRPFCLVGLGCFR